MAESIHHKYSVRFVQLQMPPEYRHRQAAGASEPALSAQLREPTRQRASSDQAVRSIASAAAGSGQAASSRELTARERRQFKLPRNVQVQPVKQTLVQMDVPPGITLKQEIPLPTMLLWTQTTAPPMRRRFVAPAVRREVPKVTQSLPSAPTLDLPNRELNPAELNVAAVIPTEKPRLVRPPAVASPVARTGQEPAKQIPQIGLADSAQPSAVNLISLPPNPLRSSGMLVLPPANQIAASDAGLAGSAHGHEGGTGAGEQGSAAAGRGSLTSAPSVSAGADGGNGSGAPSSGKIAGAAAGANIGVSSGSGTAAAGNGTSSAGNGAWSASGSAIGDLPGGVTRIDLPKEGTFGVVVLGSASSAPYPESVGALSGKVVYTVYLKVGLRKSWILQYCLPGGKTQTSANGQSTTPVQAPWPFLIMRSDQRGAADPDYIILHGMVTNAGKFDQLAMVFPDDLEKKQLLMDSLKLWAFRPASRDGVPVAVEVLLIIPREGE